MSYTTDPEEARNSEIDPKTGLQDKYVILSEEERAKGFVRPLYRSYWHEKCGTKTMMGLPLCETYARDPKFYTGTYCAQCSGHFPVGENGEFFWVENGVTTDIKVGT